MTLDVVTARSSVSSSSSTHVWNDIVPVTLLPELNTERLVLADDLLDEPPTTSAVHCDRPTSGDETFTLGLVSHTDDVFRVSMLQCANGLLA